MHRWNSRRYRIGCELISLCACSAILRSARHGGDVNNKRTAAAGRRCVRARRPQNVGTTPSGCELAPARAVVSGRFRFLSMARRFYVNGDPCVHARHVVYARMWYARACAQRQNFTHERNTMRRLTYVMMAVDANLGGILMPSAVTGRRVSFFPKFFESSLSGGLVVYSTVCGGINKMYVHYDMRLGPCPA